MTVLAPSVRWFLKVALPIGILIGAGSAARGSEQYVVAGVFYLAAAVGAVVSAVRWALQSRQFTGGWRVGLASILCIGVVYAAYVTVANIRGSDAASEGSSTTGNTGNVNQNSGDQSPNISGVGGDVNVTIGDGQQQTPK